MDLLTQVYSHIYIQNSSSYLIHKQNLYIFTNNNQYYTAMH